MLGQEKGCLVFLVFISCRIDVNGCGAHVHVFLLKILKIHIAEDTAYKFLVIIINDVIVFKVLKNRVEN